MKIFGSYTSTATRKVLVVLHEKNHGFEFVPVDLKAKEQKSPAHVEMHPFGAVPILEDEGFRLYESRAILRYLDRRLPAPALTPPKLRDHARMEQWISVEQSYWSAPAMALAKQLYPKRPDVAPNPDVISAVRPAIERALDVADKALATQEFFAGDTFSLADICWMPYVEYLLAAEQAELLQSRQNFMRWWRRTSSRPSWAKLVALHRI